MSKEDKVVEALEHFVYKVSTEGLDYAIRNYPPSEDCPDDLIEACELACEVLDNVEAILEEYMEEYDLEWS